MVEESKRTFIETKILYHVSPISNIDSIKKRGLLPEKSRGSPGVYLASDPQHAMGYMEHHDQEESIIVLVDVSKLDMNKLEPDDKDFPDILSDPDGEEGGKAWWDHTWQESLYFSGQCFYQGVIPPHAIINVKKISKSELKEDHIHDEIIPYGYWITPKGEIVNVPQYGHENVARRINNGNNNKYKFMRDGAIRIVAEEYPRAIGIELRTPSVFAAKALSGLLRKIQPDSIQYDHDGQYMEGDWKKISMLVLQYALKNKAKIQDGDLITEGTEEKPYGYWITPEGELVPVENTFGHYDKAVKITNHKFDQFTFLDSGAIRMVVQHAPSEIEVEAAYPSPAAAKTLAKFLRAQRPEEVYFDDTYGGQDPRGTWQKISNTVLKMSLGKKDDIIAEGTEEMPYGYWITPDGKKIEVGDDHEKTSLELSNGRYNLNDFLKLGAIRVIADSYPIMNVQTCTLKSSAIKGLSKLFKELSPSNVYYDQLDYPELDILNSIQGSWKKIINTMINRLPKKTIKEVSGYIPNKKQANDPRWKTALTIDIKPDTMKRNAKAFGNNISRAGIPPQANPNGKF